MAPSPQIPPPFTAKKAAILSSLSAPESAYNDLSPKGTVDEAIMPLIDRINGLEGIVTTSSCAGRVSVFLEGRKGFGKKDMKGDSGVEGENGDSGVEQRAVPGGKGEGGRWLFVSHEPVPICRSTGDVSRELGLEPMKGEHSRNIDMDPSHLRFARFQFEPMILHVMTASLHHSQPILTAAINAGFRESGVQSLKNLDNVNSFPMVAIRSSGLALESVVGLCQDLDNDVEEDKEDGYESPEMVESIVNEEYLEILLRLANERFKTNSERMKRFEDALFHRPDSDWEDGEARKERKRAKGLRQQELLRAKRSEGNGNGPRQLEVDEGISLIDSVPSLS